MLDLNELYSIAQKLVSKEYRFPTKEESTESIYVLTKPYEEGVSTYNYKYCLGTYKDNNLYKVLPQLTELPILLKNDKHVSTSDILMYMQALRKIVQEHHNNKQTA
jgi:hypothetical protein